jgi:hypothetical protein
VRGEDGDDLFIGGPGADDFIGNAGTDTVDHVQSAEGVRVTIDGVADDGAAADVSGNRRAA